MKCKYAKSEMTPCVMKDGDICWAFGNDEKPVCVGCEHSPKFLGVPYPKNWKATVARYKAEHQ